jgi:protein SCO1/2
MNEPHVSVPGRCAQGALMRRLGIRAFFCAAMLLYGQSISSASAAAKSEYIHGLVLAVTSQDGEAIIRHDAFGSMPAMTMPFRILPTSEVATLQVGNSIDATLDMSSDPWTLHDVKVRTTQTITSEPGVIRRVTPLRLGDVVPDTPMFDQSDRPFQFSQLRGKDVVLAFIYTRCKDPRMCPVDLRQVSRTAATHWEAPHAPR